LQNQLAKAVNSIGCQLMLPVLSVVQLVASKLIEAHVA